MSKYRIIIIGAGIVGATLAQALTRDGHGVHVVEQAEPGMGVTARSSGWVTWITADPARDPEHYAARRQAFERYAALDARFNGSLIAKRQGALRWLGEQGKTEAMIAAHEAAGSAVERVDTLRLRTLAPALAFPPPLAAYAPDDFALDARATAVRMLDDAMARGATLHTNAYAIAVQTKGDAVSAINVDDHVQQADVIIVAAGVATNALLEPFGGANLVQTSPAALVRFSLEDAPKMPILSAPDLEVHNYGSNTLSVVRPVPTQRADDTLAAAEMGEEAKNALRAAMPRLKNLKRIGSSIGDRPVPTSGKPLAHQVEGVRGLYAAVAHPGVTLAPQMAEDISALVAQRL